MRNLPTTAAIDVLHVDDEALCRRTLQRLVNDLPQLNYKASFCDAESCYDYMKSNNSPCIIFLDVSLPGRNGFWLANQLKGSQASIVFVTNHAEYADAAFEANALHYVLKPVTQDSLSGLVQKIKDQKSKIDALFIDQVADFYSRVETHGVPKRIFVSAVDKVDVVNLDELLYITAKASNYSEFVVREGDAVLSSKTIKTYEEVLRNHPDFLRIHKSHIINKKYLRAVSRKHRSVKALMSNGEELEISYQRKDEILELLLC